MLFHTFSNLVNDLNQKGFKRLVQLRPLPPGFKQKGQICKLVALASGLHHLFHKNPWVYPPPPYPTKFNIRENCSTERAAQFNSLRSQAKTLGSVVGEVYDLNMLIELAKQRNLVLAPFHNRRWDSDFLTVQKLIQEQRLGDIKVFESSFNRFRPAPRQRWREQDIPGAGILYDLGPHLIDQALCLFGIPQTISATLRKSRPGSQAVDYFHLQLHYADKEILLHSDPYSTGPNPRFRVKGTKGTYIKDGLDPQEQRLRDGMLPDHDGWAAEKPDEYGTLYTETGKQRVTSECGGYQHLYNNLADAIVAEAPLAVSAEQALDGIKIIQQACTMLR